MGNKRNLRRRRRGGGGKKPPQPPIEKLAEVIPLATRENRDELIPKLTHALDYLQANGGSSKPETGQRTPRPSIQRWDRQRFAELTLDRVVTILRKAEDGDTEELADLWLRMLKTDAHLASVWESRLAPVYSARWEVLPAEVDASTAPLAKRAADGCAEALRCLDDFPGVMAAMLNARGTGFEVAELVWCRGRILGVEGWVPKILPIHARRFRFDDHFEIGLWDDGRACNAMRDAGWPVTELSSRGARIVRLPAGKYVVHQPVGIHDYPTATGLVHAVARWWWVKQTVIKYWLGGAEIGANPRLIGEMTQAAVGITLDEFHADLEALAADAAIVLREGTKLTIHEGKAKASSEVWDTLFKRMDLAMSKIILGSTLNVEIDSSGGNRAASESQADITIRPRQQQDQAQFWSTMKRDVFSWILKYNPHIFAPGSPVPSGRSVLVEETASIDQLAVDSGAVKVDELRQSRGLPLIGGAAGQAFISPITRGPGEATSPTPDAPPTTSPTDPATPDPKKPTQ